MQSIKLTVASEIKGRVTGNARDAILPKVQEQVSILNSTFSWKESDQAAAKRATHALADLAKNGVSPSMVVSCRGSGERDYRMRSYSGFSSTISTSKLLSSRKKTSFKSCCHLSMRLRKYYRSDMKGIKSESSNGIRVLNAKNTMQKAKEKNLKGYREKQQFSTESSITSMCVVETAGGVASPGPLFAISGTISAYESLTLRGYDVVDVVLEDHGLLNEGRIMSYMRNKLPVLVLPPVPKDYASRSCCNSYGTKRRFNVKTVARIVKSDARKVICKEAERIKPVAVVLGSRGRSLIQSVLQGSVEEYCFHHCKAAPVVIVPRKDAGDASIL
ncbi:Bifunctional dethiobiotin synthetase/7,8-diamino-pelargonic acid aminotransferase [Arachis hypogaea]|nr:Bifunctional dethiobiotin synthetase/7,8-diamino-pelargonic acid aminotransferase [Arachis hypogaea]